MNKYESVIIINPNVDEAGLKALEEKFTGLINENGKVESVENRGKKRLEYEIKIVEALLDSLDSRKDNQYRQLVENYYIENKTYTEVMPIINIYNRYHYFELCKKVLNEFLELI